MTTAGACALGPAEVMVGGGTVIGAAVGWLGAALQDLYNGTWNSSVPDTSALPAALTPEQEALRDMVNDATLGGRRPLSVGDAEAALDLADQAQYPGVRAKAGDVGTPSNWGGAGGQPHIHLPGAGRGGHVPVDPGVRPR